MKSSLLATILITALATTAAAAANPPTGYQLVTESATTPNPARVQVIDFFWYGCPYCNLFEPELRSWLASKPDKVDFIRIPAITRQGWSHYARTYYTAETLGVLDPLHERLFIAINRDNQDLGRVDKLADFFAKYGVNPARFKETYNSEEVSRKVQEARLLTRRYGIDSVPAIVVNGKYRTNPELAGGASRVLDVVNELIAVEQKNAATH